MEDITGIHKFYQYFKSASKTAGGESTLDSTRQPLGNKKKRPQQDLHTCQVCNKTISRGNKASRERHANSKHKNDHTYDYTKAIVPIYHQAAITAKKISVLVNML